jgi:hypothetical protein
LPQYFFKIPEPKNDCKISAVCSSPEKFVGYVLNLGPLDIPTESQGWATVGIGWFKREELDGVLAFVWNPWAAPFAFWFAGCDLVLKGTKPLAEHAELMVRTLVPHASYMQPTLHGPR